ncbi:phosphonate metabolism protein/1,5-bisphosphokinase (PRPP-forming) PhnN [Ruegeria arenilitoris]|uniref:phosphonate metabolism protein/1,5-bisphosphokinase (PRPP-forming) PhnN n=1 Tax=Ruegeria arenilitoris TaxID=1173585 RepID=UPI0014814FCA|nr:phosphonate metabolism protein/1,5-bisphosphokinase (PRPP-forming) PhnN [Ruegeria arenilitoris]
MSLATVIAVVGPSGVGKDSVMQALVARAIGICLARRVITRPEGEEGEDFDRVSDTEFHQMVARDAFALHWSAHGLFYGVPRTIEKQRQRADAVLVNLSRSVLLQAQEVFGDLIVISLTADPEVLAQRLLMRGRESAPEQTRRLACAKVPLPEGLKRVIEIDNSGPLEATVESILDQLQPERT